MHFFTAMYDVASVQGRAGSFSAGDCVRAATNLLEMLRHVTIPAAVERVLPLFRLVMYVWVV